MSNGISVITCTGGRAEALSLCFRWLSPERQTFTGPIQHVLINDVEDPFPVPDNCYPVWMYPRWKPGQNTLGRNLIVGLEKAQHDIIVFVEDDDWIAPDYLEFMHEVMSGDVVMAGESTSYYYYLPNSHYRIIKNNHHASLGQTAIRREAIPTLLKSCKNPINIDIRSWGKINGQALLFEGMDDKKLVVGMKGLPGRPGIGSGHKPGFCNNPDPDWEMLWTWLGDDCRHYQKFIKSAAA